MDAGKRVQAGETCLSHELGDLVVRSITDLPLDGKQLRTETALVSIQRGVDPDPSWFQIPPEITIMERKALTAAMGLSRPRLT